MTERIDPHDLRGMEDMPYWAKQMVIVLENIDERLMELENRNDKS